MPDINHVLSSTDHYRQAFEDGLAQILHYKTAGTCILACANLFAHPASLVKHRAQLQSVYDDLCEYYLACQREGRQPDDAKDDIAVMHRLLDIGLDNLDPVITREVSSNQIRFLLNYNPLRAFRPTRMSKTADFRLDTAFNPDGFHFDKPFLAKEMFAEGEILGRQVSLLYNKFPIMEHHALLVLDKAQHQNQFLTKNCLDDIARLQAAVQTNIPGFVMAYNSLGAGASVNHLHFHVYLETTPLPVFSAQYKHNGGEYPYPARCLVLHSTDEAWKLLQSFHQDNLAYNLILKDEKIFCLPRNSPQKVFDGIDIGVYGWSHLAGFFNVDNKHLLDTISVEQLAETLQAVSNQALC